jgi:hypothetical protein
MANVSGDAGSSAPLFPDQKSGVWGQSDTGYGVVGTSLQSSGVQGGSVDGSGAVGTSTNSNGVTAISTGGNGLYARGGQNAAVLDGKVIINGTAAVQVLNIVGGGDLAEAFIVENDAIADPGTVMVIADGAGGALAVSTKAYDRRVAGVVSGAEGLESGLILRQSGAPTETRIALAGMVYCKAEAFTRPIRLGDFLTTSDAEGCAMAAPDMQTSRGAILGKAMSELESGKGFVLALVNLQ